MQVMVLGAGVIGTSCAYYLDKAGHDVVVLDRQSGPALETSFANAGGICPGFAGPWAAPGMPARVARWLFGHHRPIVLHPRLDPYQWRWLLSSCATARPNASRATRRRTQRIAHYSKACLKDLRADTGIAFDHGSGGVCRSFAPGGARRGRELSARAG